MSFICPICNGFEPLSFNCPECHELTEDYGRFSDFMGPYSAYRPIDDLKLTNGFSDLINHQCVHVVFCSSCHQDYRVNVAEQYYS